MYKYIRPSWNISLEAKVGLKNFGGCKSECTYYKMYSKKFCDCYVQNTFVLVYTIFSRFRKIKYLRYFFMLKAQLLIILWKTSIRLFFWSVFLHYIDCPTNTNTLCQPTHSVHHVLWMSRKRRNLTHQYSAFQYQPTMISSFSYSSDLIIVQPKFLNLHLRLDHHEWYIKWGKCNEYTCPKWIKELSF